MADTTLVTLTVHMTGWYDTGRTSVAVRVGTHRYHPYEPASKDRHTDPEEIFTASAEVFMTESAEDQITGYLMKALDAYVTTLSLP